jgi:hypothetical protein
VSGRSAERALFRVSDEIEHILAQEVDPETGEITEATLELLDQLEGARDAIALDVAAYAKGERAEAEKIHRVAHELSTRAEVHERRAERLIEYIGRIVGKGAKLEDERVTIGWHKGTFIEILDEKLLPPAFWRQPATPPPQPDKKAIAAELVLGRPVPGAVRKSSHTIQVK